MVKEKTNKRYEDFKSEITDEKVFDERYRYVSNGLEQKDTGPIKKIWDEVQALWKYVSSDEVSWTEKIAPMAALVYLVSPIDLIPDAIPVVGLVDDVGVISFVISQMGNVLDRFRTGGAAKVGGSILDRLADIILGDIIKRPQLTYEEAAKYFNDHKNDSPSIVNGVMIRERLPNGELLVYQIFLNEMEEIVCDPQGLPLGGRIQVSGLDKELEKVFKDKDVKKVRLR